MIYSICFKKHFNRFLCNMNESLRIDKWLWAVRIFKTRSLAADACDRNKVMLNNVAVKPSRNLKNGDVITVQNGSLFRTFTVLGMPANRVGAKEVPKYCTETTPEEEIKKHEALRKAAAMWRDPGTGRPTKKDRRELDDFVWGGKFGDLD